MAAVRPPRSYDHPSITAVGRTSTIALLQAALDKEAKLAMETAGEPKDGPLVHQLDEKGRKVFQREIRCRTAMYLHKREVERGDPKNSARAATGQAAVVLCDPPLIAHPSDERRTRARVRCHSLATALSFLRVRQNDELPRSEERVAFRELITETDKLVTRLQRWAAKAGEIEQGRVADDRLREIPLRQRFNIILPS